jgi:DNA repair protein SbcC/Rad50
MRLARLLLQAFGPFTDIVLDFAAGPSDLHLIYGPNEAGKSSALRAMTDLRFGIPRQSPDDFVHPSHRLRIAGLFIDTDGIPIGLVRRKGRGSTLARFDIATMEPDPNLPIMGEHELALGGGLERCEFETLFGLNHARLRAGGNLLLKGEGELGSALFEASAGTRGITAILAALEADAKQIYNPHGRTQNATINEARRQLEAERNNWREAQTRPADWQTLNRAHEAAKIVLAETDQALEGSRRRENELTELRTVEPLLREHDRVLAELEALADVPDLPENARLERLAAEQTLCRAEEDLQDAELEFVRSRDALERLVIEPVVLEHAEAIERLAAGLEAGARSRIEARREQAIVARIEGDLAVATARIAPGRELSAILDTLPSDAEHVALDGHLLETSRLGERLDGYRERAETLDQALTAASEEVPAVPDPAARQALSATLQQAQALGDVARQRGDLERQCRDLEAQLRLALADLGCDSTDTIGRAQPLLEAEIAAARQALAEIEASRRKAHDEDLRLGHDLKEQRLRQRQLAAEGEVITAETLRLARARRDEGWALIRRTYVERSQDADDLARAFDPDRALPDAFEAAQGEADRQADLLRADAKRAAGTAECCVRIEQMEQRRRELESEIRTLDVRCEDRRAAWTARLTQARLPSLDAEALREWQGRRQHALELAERLAASRADRDRGLAAAAMAASAIASALCALGQPPVCDAGEPGSLPALIEQAFQWDQRAAAAEVEHAARAKAARAQRAERDTIGAAIAETEKAMECHSAALEAWHTRLCLPSGSSAETVKARLDELDRLARQWAVQGDARLRLCHHQAVVDDLAAQVAQLTAVLGEPAPVTVDDFADRLRKRLIASREQDRQRSALCRDRAGAQEKQRRAEAERAAQKDRLARLCSAAHVDTAERLPEREESAKRKRQASTALAKLRQQLAQASTRPLDTLRQRLAGQDAVAMESERRRCRDEIERREEEQTNARRAEEQARRAVDAIDASDRAAQAREAMESAAARYRAAIRPWARLKLAHALLQDALKRFRERAQAPMVARASTYFALMTGGRYERLIADEEADRPVLRAERAGVCIGVEAMSDGTADQLYLALRLAALDLRRASHPEMPLVLDDVLITSDDERAGNILRALARFAEGGQVMLFTHHGHLIDVARSVLDDRSLAIHTL